MLPRHTNTWLEEVVFDQNRKKQRSFTAYATSSTKAPPICFKLSASSSSASGGICLMTSFVSEFSIFTTILFVFASSAIESSLFCPASSWTRGCVPFNRLRLTFGQVLFILIEAGILVLKCCLNPLDWRQRLQMDLRKK